MLSQSNNSDRSSFLFSQSAENELRAPHWMDSGSFSVFVKFLSCALSTLKQQEALSLLPAALQPHLRVRLRPSICPAVCGASSRGLRRNELESVGGWGDRPMTASHLLTFMLSGASNTTAAGGAGLGRRRRKKKLVVFYRCLSEERNR